MDERARNKRKAQELESDDDDEESADEEDDEEDDVSLDLEGIDKELPGQGLKKRKADDDEPAKKKAKLAEPAPETEEATETLTAHQQKKLAKSLKKAEKKAEKKASKPEKAPKQSKKAAEDEDEDTVVPSQEAESESDDETNAKGAKNKHMVPIDISGLVDEEEANQTSQSSTPNSTTFDSPTETPAADLTSTSTSITSDAAGTTTDRPSSSSKKLIVPSDTSELRIRLAAKIAALRLARKADDADGKPIRTREDLLESRRLKQIKSKAHKKELWAKRKAEEDAKREEALASARNSPMLSFGSPGSPEQETQFSFGKMAFTDGTQMSQDLSYVKDKGKKKQNLDPKSALAKLEAQKKRLSNLDDDKRKEVLEKETWLAARKRAEGEKVRNDESLLKKAVKRKEKVKKKSEKEWGDRMDAVKFAAKKKSDKRESNIRQRREQKAAGKGGKKGKGKGTPKKKAGRPGFEGGGFGGKKK
jgi:hypothetical protein